jgi:hypothetical protein
LLSNPRTSGSPRLPCKLADKPRISRPIPADNSTNEAKSRFGDLSKQRFGQSLLASILSETGRFFVNFESFPVAVFEANSFFSKLAFHHAPQTPFVNIAEAAEQTLRGNRHRPWRIAARDLVLPAPLPLARMPLAA